MTEQGRPADAFLDGENCYLRPLRRADIEGNWLRWFNDPEVTRHMIRGAFPTTLESQTAFYDSVVDSQFDLVLAIVARDDDEHIGNVGLHRIDPHHRHAEFGIVLGEQAYWGRGIGTEATRLICDHGFRRLGLHRIWLGVLASHESAVHVYERVGFQREGTAREEVSRDGAWWDVHRMGLLASDLA